MTPTVFPHFNTFRFYAAFLVFIQHAEEIAHLSNLPSWHLKSNIKDLGAIGVTMFFTLSGFLITYILIKKYDKESLKQFYINRLLRIWPLYFIILLVYKIIVPMFDGNFVSFFANEQNSDVAFQPIVEITPTTEWFLLLFMMPHVLLALGHVFNPLFIWSIGVEELFYLIWPKMIKNKVRIVRKLKLLLAIYLVVYLFCFSMWMYAIKSDLTLERNVFQGLTTFLYLQRISCMVIGGYFAFRFVEQSKDLIPSTNSFIVWICIFILAAIIVGGIYYPVFINEIIAGAFGYILYRVSLGDKIFDGTILKLFFNKATELGGKYSYGIYMYHTMCLYLSVGALRHFNALSKLNLYLGGFILTLFFSIISFEIVEKRFLYLKK
jgi:peptidoglycan/LPS O-acetylase OafA/YrhL